MWFALILGHSCYDKKYQTLKRKGSSGQYREAVRIFNSRKVKAIKEGEDIFVDEQVLPQQLTMEKQDLQSFSFQNGAPKKDR